MSADAWLDPALAAAVARGDVRSVAAPVADGVDALSVPVLAPAAVAASAKATPFAFSTAGSSFKKGVSSVSCGTGT